MPAKLERWKRESYPVELSIQLRGCQRAARVCFRLRVTCMLYLVCQGHVQYIGATDAAVYKMIFIFIKLENDINNNN